MCGWYFDMEELLEETQREDYIMKIKTKIKVLEDEIKVIKKRIEPQDCGHLHTTIGVLEHRIKELKAAI